MFVDLGILMQVMLFSVEFGCKCWEGKSWQSMSSFGNWQSVC